MGFEIPIHPIGVSAKEKAQPKPTPKPEAKRSMPQGYEYRNAPATTKPLPRELDIQITPEDIGDEGTPVPGAGVGAPKPAPLQVQDMSIGIVFDSDYDGVPDEQDQCPGTTFGEQVDARGCSPSQLDHNGNPLPHRVELEITPE